jgi:hypothetical protein
MAISIRGIVANRLLLALHLWGNTSMGHLACRRNGAVLTDSTWTARAAPEFIPNWIAPFMVRVNRSAPRT